MTISSASYTSLNCLLYMDMHVDAIRAGNSGSQECECLYIFGDKLSSD